ncbi:phosphodiester glycosidase family protein [Candidatus Ozemobacteraceae bacterium]|nr:phosphodiester glycosidase family protein [Candidatus Ozemobacteraceae bacterium]
MMTKQDIDAPARIGTILMAVLFFLLTRIPAECQSWKQSMRGFMGELAHVVGDGEVGQLPAGIERIELPGVKGLRVPQGIGELDLHAWNGEPGLLNQFRKVAETDQSLVAAINGSFFGTQGVLGQLVVSGKRPPNVRQMPASFSRCFIAVLRGPNFSRWVLGETAVHGAALCLPEFFTSSRFNRPIRECDRLVHLLGGGGWIVRDRKDVHMEAYGRQKFRFRKEDQDSRHSVVAMDSSDNLYLLVFETGANLSAVSKMLRTRPEFHDVTDAIFLDGGSSSVMIANGAYLVSPLYLVDKARYTALFVRLAGWTPNKP